MTAAEPNRGHLAVAALVRRGIVSHVITQNIDGLHQRAGVPADRVIELHGNATYAKCLDCGRPHEIEPNKAAFVRDETLPLCTAFGSDMVKPAKISFGPSMPEDDIPRDRQRAV